MAPINWYAIIATADPFFAFLASAAAIAAIIAAATADPFFAFLAATTIIFAIMTAIMYAVDQVYIKWVAKKNAEAKAEAEAEAKAEAEAAKKRADDENMKKFVERQ
jgi:hypothetical protein